MSPGTMARQHAPHMLMPEDRTFPASTRHAYGTRVDDRPVSRAPLPRPLQRLRRYQHPGYGTLIITVEGGTLQPRLGTMDLTLGIATTRRSTSSGTSSATSPTSSR